MQHKLTQFQDHLAEDQKSSVDDFLGYLGELIAEEYIRRMKLASEKDNSTHEMET